MAVDRRLLRPYPAIGPSHPFAAELAHLRAQVAADPGLAGPTGAPVVIRRRLRGRPGPDGAWAIDRFCWSAQWWERGTPPRFRVRTLIYEPRRGEASVFEFPADPSLPAAAESSPLRDPAAQVLRYIPLTRITFRVGDRVAADVAWIATHAPRLDAALAGIRRGVEARLAGEGAERAFCHLDSTRTTSCTTAAASPLLDLDDAAVADPCSDLSAMLTILAHHGAELFGTSRGDRRLAAAYLSG